MAAESEEQVDIFVDYLRVEQRSSGNIVVQKKGQTCSTEGFELVEFKDLLSLLARTISKTQVARVVLRRVDQPSLFPYVLDQPTVELFRSDPVAAIRSLSYEVPEVTIGKRPTQDYPVEVKPLRVGYDTLADAFGDNVYVKTRATSIECPGCGMWGNVTVNRTGQGVFTCHRKCASDFRVVISLSRLWAAVPVDSLLDNERTPRFFLPRAWNDGRPWITREELHDKYLAYKAEKEAACNQVAMG